PVTRRLEKAAGGHRDRETARRSAEGREGRRAAGGDRGRRRRGGRGVNSRVGRLAVRMRGAGRSGASAAGEAFARDALVRALEALEDRAPGRIVVVQRLETRWRLRSAALASPGEADAVSAGLATWVEERVR